ncbi:hypothetical protein [Celeribacter halophilus]|uniref:hypothetical protein n=1 Tax=Celeribacter halophilus TaxID=576117 RepID=UPI003A93AFFC
MDFTEADLEAFLSKVDFNFSTPEGWNEFLSERQQGGAGRDADGIQLRDITNYAVGTAMITSIGRVSLDAGKQIEIGANKSITLRSAKRIRLTTGAGWIEIDDKGKISLTRRGSKPYR